MSREPVRIFYAVYIDQGAFGAPDPPFIASRRSSISTVRTKAASNEGGITEVPVYSIPQAARYVGVSPATLRSWFLGTSYRSKLGDRRWFEPVLSPSQGRPPRLSFSNLIEAHMLVSLRRKHKLSLATIREAVEVAAVEHDVSRPLLSSLQAAYGELFLEQFGNLVHLRRSERLLLQDHFHRSAERVHVGAKGEPLRYFPYLPTYFVSADPARDRSVVIDINVGFGMPTITDSGIATSVVLHRIDAGEEVDEVAQDYEVDPALIMAAIAFERASA